MPFFPIPTKNFTSMRVLFDNLYYNPMYLYAPKIPTFY